MVHEPSQPVDYTISPLQPADYDAVTVFWRGQDGIGLGESDERGPLEQYLLRNPGMSGIARSSSGTVVGAVLCGHDGRRGYLHHLAVAHECRRQGLGTALVRRSLAQLASAGIPKCNIFVFNDNEGGRQFWERLGYHPVGWSPMQHVIER
jgi:ribosomal protein S18 acetylase RimI-like enzyme